MDHDITSFTIKTFLREMREHLQQAQGLAEAADACARVGQTAEGVALANKTDELIHDAETLLGMTAWLARHRDDLGTDNWTVTRGDDSVASDMPLGAAKAAEAIGTFLHLAHQRLQRAVGVARAAEIRAATAGPQIGARMALDVEPALYETKTLVNAASFLHRLSSAAATAPPG